jgi:pimeloyl-ACP methyl ester carboxylesterase|tara:strand:- start:178 stop:510 length:333 start_codon:yes stop_codon:yes gene_type:complete
MDGSLSTPFMQYPELSTSFELACMTHCDGLDSRASFEELTASCAAEISASARSGRQVLLVGESFGATLAIAVAHRLRDVQVATFFPLYATFFPLGHSLQLSDLAWHAARV